MESGISRGTGKCVIWDKAFLQIFSWQFDTYELIRKDGILAIDNDKIKFIEDILSEKELTDDMINKYQDQIIHAITNKKEFYPTMDFSKLDWDFPFLKQVIKNASVVENIREQIKSLTGIIIKD